MGIGLEELPMRKGQYAQCRATSLNQKRPDARPVAQNLAIKIEDGADFVRMFNNLRAMSS